MEREKKGISGSTVRQGRQFFFYRDLCQPERRGSAWWYLGLGVEPPPVSVATSTRRPPTHEGASSAHIAESCSATPFAPTRRPREERRGIARDSRGGSRTSKGADDARRQSPRPERSHHRATTERERGRTLGKVNTFNQDRTFGVPTFPPRSFCHLLFPAFATRNSDCGECSWRKSYRR